MGGVCQTQDPPSKDDVTTGRPNNEKKSSIAIEDVELLNGSSVIVDGVDKKEVELFLQNENSQGEPYFVFLDSVCSTATLTFAQFGTQGIRPRLLSAILKIFEKSSYLQEIFNQHSWFKETWTKNEVFDEAELVRRSNNVQQLQRYNYLLCCSICI